MKETNLIYERIEEKIKENNGFDELVETEEKDKDEIWIKDLIQHFFSCLDEDCTRCAYAVENNFLEFLKTR